MYQTVSTASLELESMHNEDIFQLRTAKDNLRLAFYSIAYASKLCVANDLALLIFLDIR